MNNNRLAFRRPFTRRLVRLPKDLRLHARRLVPGDQRRAQGEPGSDVRHVGVVPDEEAVVVAFAEAGRREAGVDGYGAVIWRWGLVTLSLSLFFSFFFLFFFFLFCLDGWISEKDIPAYSLSAVGDMKRE